MKRLYSIMSSNKNSIEHVLNFWFGNSTDVNYLKPKSFWYGDEQSDRLVRKTLGEQYQLAKEGKLDTWEKDPRGALALIILLDQVPRNIHRGTSEAYATDDKALEVAKIVIQEGWDKDKDAIIRRYYYSPFNHSERLEDQKKSLELFKNLGDPYHLHWAQSFHDTVREHGRFPHRDKILGRD